MWFKPTYLLFNLCLLYSVFYIKLGTKRFNWGEIKKNKNYVAEESSIEGNAVGTEGIRYEITWAVTDYV